MPEFEKGDRFKMNLVNCAMIVVFILSMPERPGCGAVDGVLCKIHDDKAMNGFAARAERANSPDKDIAE